MKFLKFLVASLLLAAEVLAEVPAQNAGARAALRGNTQGRAIAGGTAIVDGVRTYEVGTQFSELGHFGDSRVFGETLIIPGTRNDGAPVAWILNQTTGVSEEVVFPGSGNISGVFQRNGEFVFTGFLDTATGGKITYWDDAGEHITNSLADVFDVSTDGRVVGSRESIDAYYYDVGADSAIQLPGYGFAYFSAHSVTDNGSFIGGGASDENLNPSGIVYEKQVDGSYALLDVQYLTPEGLSLLRLDVKESPIGVLCVGAYVDQNGANRTGLWKLDGTYIADIGAGYMAGAKAVGNYMFVATDAGTVTSVELTNFTKETFTSTALFGAVKNFKPGSLFSTKEGYLGVIGTDPVTKLATVRTFIVKQEVTLAQVDVNTIVIPSLFVGQAGTITWGVIAGASGYEYQISKGATILKTGSVTTNSLPMPIDLAAGRYTFGVRAMTAARALPKWTYKDFVVTDLPAHVKAIISKIPAGLLDVQVQIINYQKKVTLVKGIQNVLKALIDLVPGRYVVKVLIPKKSAITVNIEKFHPAVPPSVKIMPDRKHIISWQGAGVTEIWIAKKNQLSRVVYFMKVSKGNVHKLAKVLPAGEHVVRVRINRADGSRSEWGPGVSF